MYSVAPQHCPLSEFRVRDQRTVYLRGERADLSLSFVQSPGELAVLLMALVKLALHTLQLQTQRLALCLSHQPIRSISYDEHKYSQKRKSDHSAAMFIIMT